MSDLTEKLTSKIPTDKLDAAKTVDIPEETTPSKEELEEISNLDEGKRTEEQAALLEKHKEVLNKKPDVEVDEDDEEEEEEPTFDEKEIVSLLDKDEDKLTDEEKKTLINYSEFIESQKTIVEKLIEKDGYQLDEAFVQELAKDGDSTETISKYYNKVAELKADEIIKSNPVVSKFAEHINNGGTIETFQKVNEPNEYASLKLDKDTDQGILEDVVRADLKAKGVDKEDIEAIVSGAKKSEKLLEKAKQHQQSIVSSDQARKQSLLAEENARIQEQKAKEAEEARQIKAMFDANKFGNFSIPTAEKSAFEKTYITPVDNEGNTLLDKKWKNITPEQAVMLDYIVYKDFDIKGLKDSNKDINLAKLRVKENNKRVQGLRDKNVSLGKQSNMTPELRGKLKSFSFMNK